jgi:hypothetical protein
MQGQRQVDLKWQGDGHIQTFLQAKSTVPLGSFGLLDSKRNATAEYVYFQPEYDWSLFCQSIGARLAV